MTVQSSVALLGALLMASTAGAQANPARNAAAANQCDIQSGNSTQISTAYEALSNVYGVESDAEKRRNLQQAIRTLDAPLDRPQAEVARHWVLGQALIAYTMLEGQSPVGRRGDFGFTTNPDAVIDIVAAADTSLRAVERAHPGCGEQIASMRRLPFIQTVNAAVNAFNAGNVDSARVLADRAATLDSTSPELYHLLGNIAVRQQNLPLAVQHLERTAELTRGDTTRQDLYQNSLESMAVLLQNQAQAATGDEQVALARRAASIFRDLAAASPGNVNIQVALAQSLSMAGDTAAVSGIYAQMIANPANYSTAQLLDAGIGAANTGRTQDAIGLLEAGLAQNPFYRDALFALASVYLGADQYDKAIAYTNRLIAVDPSNPDNLYLLGNAYQGILAGTRDNRARRAYTDSLVRTSAAAERMPVKVSFMDFAQMSEQERVLNGMIENLTDTPRDFVLRVEFLDAQGNVLDVKEERLDQVDGRGSKPFSIAVQRQGVVAFRYAPITS